MPYIVYSLEERIDMVRLREQGFSLRHVVDLFAASHPGRPIPSKTTVQRIILKYYETGKINVGDKKCTYPSRRLSEEVRFAVCVLAEEIPKKTCSQIAQELQLSESSVWRVLREEKLRGQITQKTAKALPSASLALDENQLIFSQTMKYRLNKDENDLRRVCFSNECTILFVSSLNSQYIRLYPWRIEHLLNQPSTEYQKLHVWTGVVGNKVFGPFFIRGTLDGDKYLKMLRAEVVPALRESEGDSPVIWYKQDELPPLYTPQVWTYLCKEFPGQWVGRYGPIQRRNSNPDISLLDLALWSRLKDNLRHGKNIRNLSTLQNSVEEFFCNMDPVTVCSKIRASYDRSLRIQIRRVE